MFNTIVNNYAEGHGGGIYFINESGGTIDSCEFKNNEANWGGGMTCTVNCDPTIVNSLFEANTTNNVGGGIFIRSSSSPLITDCDFINNIQVSNPLGSGGGVCIYVIHPLLAAILKATRFSVMAAECLQRTIQIQS